jgi:hypothetical protein
MTDESRLDAELLQQFAKSLQATATLAEGVQNLHREVCRNTEQIGNIRINVATSMERVQDLFRLVRGEGVTDSLNTLVIELQTRLHVMEKWKRDYLEEVRVKGNKRFSVMALWITVIATVIAAIISTVIPLLFR